MIKIIIVALDGSEYSLKALDYGCELAEKHRAKLLMLHAYRSTSDLRGTEGFNQLVAKRKQTGEAVIEEARRRVAEASFEIEETLLEGPGADAVIRVANVRNADLIVMGTRGMGSFEGLLFGSVSTKVTHHAPCSVLVVR